MSSLVEAVRLFRQERYREALKIFEGDDTAGGLESVYYGALCCAKLGWTKKAILKLEKILDREVNFLRLLQARLLLSVLYCEKREYQRSEKVLREILEQGMESSQVLAALGHTLWAQGKVKEAISTLNKAISEDSGNSTAINSLAYVLADQGILMKKALALGKKALSMDGENPNYLDTLGWIYFKMGQMKLAHYYLGQALDRKPDNSVFQAHQDAVDNALNKPRNRRKK